MWVVEVGRLKLEPGGEWWWAGDQNSFPWQVIYLSSILLIDFHEYLYSSFVSKLTF